MRSGPRGYLAATLHPWPCFLFLLPLLTTYEVGVLWLGGPRPETLRNGADAWLRWALEVFGFPHLYCAPGLLILVLLVWSYCHWSSRPTDLVSLLFGMAAESAGYAVGLWLLSRNLLTVFDQFGLEMQIGGPLSWSTAPPLLGQLVTFVGAGIYEEMVFRLGLCFVLRTLFLLAAVPGWLAWPLVLASSSLIFAAAHHFGPYGEPFVLYIFCFRALAGLYFALIYLTRGFGIAVGAHAAYDVIVGMLMG